MSKKFDCGAIIGRMHPIHIGHQYLIDTTLDLCDRVLIFLGSSQEFKTLQNPFNIATRLKMVREIYPDEQRVMIYGLPDLSNSNDNNTDWGNYLLSNMKYYLHKNPDLLVYGGEKKVDSWFDEKDLENTFRLIVPRTKIPVSGTQLRFLMYNDMREEWMKYVDPKLHKYYDILRAELLQAYSNSRDKSCCGNCQHITDMEFDGAGHVLNEYALCQIKEKRVWLQNICEGYNRKEEKPKGEWLSQYEIECLINASDDIGRNEKNATV